MARRLYNLYEAKTALSSLVDRVTAGEEIIIAKAGVPKVKLVAVGPGRKRRRPGGWEGRIRISDDFDEPLPENLQRTFQGGASEAG